MYSLVPCLWKFCLLSIINLQNLVISLSGPLGGGAVAPGASIRGATNIQQFGCNCDIWRNFNLCLCKAQVTFVFSHLKLFLTINSNEYWKIHCVIVQAWPIFQIQKTQLNFIYLKYYMTRQHDMTTLCFIECKSTQSLVRFYITNK